eukprot:CAMPEP_0170078388 /NCGR_PEP_ID=MMETSP0019_2-20121128/14987_1 /TAXON_ID=98059 /ORGANISM="Dinobryon sp., Strain UTEXLB2267" /LENGTH=661 /DNA_ID=CAMNT_0010291231 /DNA_START=84 /DNA_END=2069 /DNA_ORIENTATION=-
MKMFYQNVYGNRSMDEITRIEETPNYPHGDTEAAAAPTAYAVVGDSDTSVKIDNASVVEMVKFETYSDEAGTFASFSPPSAPAILSWKNLSVTTMAKRNIPSKTIIDNVDGCISGGLWGIMGASGSGKTTLLSVLSLRLDTMRMALSGDVRLNGREYNKNLLKSMSGYVMQDDLVHAMLTVQETLNYCAALRMSSSISYSDRVKRVDEVLAVMGIDYCRDVIVGDSRNKGISGGERKRLCVAMELLNKPKLLFLDEPTSGLDSTTAFDLMETLKDLADRGECTVVCTIHQPQTKIYNLLDNLLLMKKGSIVYQGSCAKAEEFFALQGYPCPDRTNPADHLLDLISLGTKLSKEQARLKYLSVPINLDFGLDKEDFTARAVHNWFFQFWVLSMRTLQERLRRWDTILTNIVVTCLVATFIGMGAWNDIGNSQAAASKINAILFFCVIHQGVVSSLQGTYAFPLERALMLRERSAGSYYVSAYFLSKANMDMLIQLVNPIIFSIFVFNLTGIPGGLHIFFRFMAFNMLLSICATSLANMCCCLFVSIELSCVVLACCMEITRLYSAFFVSPQALQNYPKWKFFDAISYMKYGYVGLCLNEYQNWTIPCTKKSDFVGGKCLTGDDWAAKYYYQKYDVTYCFGLMIVYIVFCRVVSYLALRFIKI